METANKTEKTLGESRVRTSFNTSGSGVVDGIKVNSAALIDQCEYLLGPQPEGSPAHHPEKIRLVRLAQTAFEEAAMWAVKAATY